MLRKLTGGALPPPNTDADFYVMAGIILGFVIAAVLVAVTALMVLVVVN